MIGVLPSVSSNDVQGVMGLAAFLADPDACKQRLQELNDLATTLQDKSDTLGFTQASLDQYKQDLDTREHAIALDAAAIETQKDDLAAQIKRESDKYQQMVDLINTKTADFDKQDKALQARESDVSRREVAVTAAEALIKAEQADVDKLKKDYETKLAQLKTIIA